MCCINGRSTTEMAITNVKCYRVKTVLLWKMSRIRDVVQAARDKTPVMLLGVEGKTELDKTRDLTSYLRGLKQ